MKRERGCGIDGMECNDAGDVWYKRSYVVGCVVISVWEQKYIKLGLTKLLATRCVLDYF